MLTFEYRSGNWLHEKLHFDSNGCYDGVQYYHHSGFRLNRYYKKRGLGDFKCDSKTEELKRYFIHGKEYCRQDYEIIINKCIKDIQEVTHLPLDLVKMVLQY